MPSKAFFNAGHTGRGGGCPQQTRIARNGEWGGWRLSGNQAGLQGSWMEGGGHRGDSDDGFLCRNSRPLPEEE